MTLIDGSNLKSFQICVIEKYLVRLPQFNEDINYRLARLFSNTKFNNLSNVCEKLSQNQLRANKTWLEVSQPDVSDLSWFTVWLMNLIKFYFLFIEFFFHSGESEETPIGKIFFLTSNVYTMGKKNSRMLQTVQLGLLAYFEQ